ncbi:MFS transporter [Candidatus Dojkabacteria bacterium]|uniref:MFS transporter n=1 Tax=Candidatus Dojkabacteria bacterium TaxID=2099670 RepID=A0A955L7Y9_9BACT|nr:MFS transporter [Candidatus Dojkabacteria bacterium]
MKTHLNKFLISEVLYYFSFWTILPFPLFGSYGLTTKDIFSLLAFYPLVVVFLEYPTGVIGDYFGHKFSSLLGVVVRFFFFLTLLYETDAVGFYYISMFLLALASALKSGSDTAYLKSLAGDEFKSGLSNMKSYSVAAVSISSLVGGIILLFAIKPIIYINIATSIIIIILLIPLPGFHNASDRSGNIFKHSFQSFGYLKALPYIGLLIALVGVTQGYLFSIKTLLNSLETITESNIFLISIAIGVSTFVRIVGFKLSVLLPKLKEYTVILSAIFVTVISALLNIPLLFIGVLLLHNIFFGIVEHRYEYKLSEGAPKAHRASLLSLASLVKRGTTALYLWFAGYILGIYSFAAMLYLTIILFGVILLGSLVVMTNFNSKALIHND